MSPFFAQNASFFSKMQHRSSADLDVVAKAEKLTEAGAWSDLPSPNVAEEVVTSDWLHRVCTPSQLRPIRVLAHAGEFRPVQWCLSAGATSFRSLVSATHTVTQYKSILSISHDEDRWGSFCTCPAGYDFREFG